MTPRKPRRRLRVRRKRKGKGLASELREGAVNSVGDAAVEATARGSVEVVGEFGGCVVEAIGSAAVLVALLTVPAYLLIR